MPNIPSCPALLIAAPASGHGKTSVTAGIARYHSRRGLRVRCFKTGPDFIDPGLLEQASGQPVYNLDTWIMGEDHCRQLLHEAAAGNDLILVEGVMGLFDGTPSSADLAECFGLPVLPVIDASKMAQTFAAVLHGLATFRDSLKIAGAVANNVASERHAELLRAALPSHIKLATLPRNPDATLPSRHLGLRIAAEIDGLDQRLDRLAEAVGASCLAELPAPAEFVQPATQPLAEALLHEKTIAVARDNAFCFLYRANIDCLRKLGAQVVFFSPLKDNALPAADAIYLPGGYPELFAAELSRNESLRQQMRSHVEKNKPLLAECGGLMTLGDALEDLNGNRHAMLGLLPGIAHMGQRLHAIGSQQALIAGASIRGHTFHYSRFDTTLTPCFQAQTQDGRTGEALYRHGSLLASYVHWYFPSNPALVASWFLSEG
ncbi:cobyrinate a,c-diamide synthase [Candidatus Methylospira mobilis]|uniref:Cobyrinate a,c-diamide synthase n=1 Tax=Candidatus Methylospira mobilis TaxID=1808979 RepID=A0A5Q0BMC8_9GAMM|nr:cobyrinate a,c-diamide synthase [Candidatus Methylospira mobilis]QFY43401.1 cobyrinate a,c-diamide synthase [Candidatus Methylospira mobilis]